MSTTDELRSMAESVGLAMPQAATLMMEAADTISRIDERHAKTFEVGKRWMAKAARFESENTKLRELVEAILQCAGETKRDKGCDACPMYNEPWRNDGTWCLLRPMLRELGVEVDW